MINKGVVARAGFFGLEYLVSRPNGMAWDVREQLAQRYSNMREATRAAMRLPSRLRAFALPTSA